MHLKISLGKLWQCSCQDLPIVVFAFLALISHLSTPDPPVLENPKTQLVNLLAKIPSERCRRKVVEFHQENRHDARTESVVVDAPDFVKSVCHTALDTQHISDAFWHISQHQSHKHFKQHESLHWTLNNQTMFSERLPALAYLVMVGPTDLVAAVSALVNHIYAPDHVILIHIDSKCKPSVHAGISNMTRGRRNVMLLESERVTWGSYSVVRTQVTESLPQPETGQALTAARRSCVGCSSCCSSISDGTFSST